MFSLVTNNLSFTKIFSTPPQIVPNETCQMNDLTILTTCVTPVGELLPSPDHYCSPCLLTDHPYDSLGLR